ncbi:MAG: PQQ-binding-like beta-propeller repeat protein [Acidobacteria bacterium]|nr:PQQ-binding-like beta-propeller repeat protein [Acidobacteriota bacterium]
MGMPLRTAAVSLLMAACLPAENWPQWRGPRLDGTSRETSLPASWTTTENIAWRLPLPSRSGATPIIWGDRIFLNVAEEGKLYLWAVDRRTGAVEWKRHIGDGDHKINKQNMSSPSPVTDGKLVWVMTGTGALKCFDFAGGEKWARDIEKEYGKFGLNWGYASSPLLDQGFLYVQVLHGMKTKDPSYILKIEGVTGKNVWRAERPTAAVMESPDSYTTPALVKLGDHNELVIAGGDVLTGHDPETGKELWRGGGFNPDNNPFQRIIASPVVGGDIVYAPTRVRPMIAYRAGGKGDVTATHQVCKFNNGPDVPTPAIDEQFLYTVTDRGVVYVLDRLTGKEAYGGQRLKPGIYSSSPVLADGKVYISNEDGVTSVFRSGPKFELLAENETGEYTLSSIAVSGGQLFLRTAGHLYCIGKRP